MTDSRSLTVLHTESSLGWGGQENRTLNELLAMRELGHLCYVACQPGAKLGQRAREAGFETTEVRMRNVLDIPALLHLRRFMREKQIQIVNTHSGRDTQLAGLAARSLFGQRPRVVRTRHLALPITSRFTYSTLPDQVVTVSQYVADYLESAGVAPSQLTTVHTGIDLSRYTRDPAGGTLRQELNLSADTLLVGTVAILRRKKGHAELLEAIPEILKACPQAHFVFAGNGPQEGNLKTRIAELNLQDRVHLLGLRRDVVNVLQSLDLFVLPTYQEALGTAFVEAAAMALPVVGSNVDGVPEVVQEGITGLLVPAKNSQALGEAIRQLLLDPALRQTMGNAGRDWVSKRFSHRAMAQGMVAVYRKLLD
jgi:glycosyltransferase involved in cell wall biosynthesis